MIVQTNILRNVSSKLMRGKNFNAYSKNSSRSIAIGTDLSANTDLAWQSARPWHMDDSSGSNMAKDNANTMKDIFKGKKVAVFGIPAPFTGTCTNAHVPGYKDAADDFKGKGVDEIICYSVACPYAHHVWAENMNVDQNKISFLADVDGSWAKAYDLDVDYSAASLGVRSKRFSMFIDDGIVKSFQIVEDAAGDAKVLLEQV